VELSGNDNSGWRILFLTHPELLAPFPEFRMIAGPIIVEFHDCLSQFTSFMHLNMQSLVPKLDLLNVELSNLDILCFTVFKRG
jgi:hypothetical protein